MPTALLLLQALLALQPEATEAISAVKALINGQALTLPQEQALIAARLAVEAQAKAGA